NDFIKGFSPVQLGRNAHDRVKAGYGSFKHVIMNIRAEDRGENPVDPVRCFTDIIQFDDRKTPQTVKYRKRLYAGRPAHALQIKEVYGAGPDPPGDEASVRHRRVGETDRETEQSQRAAPDHRNDSGKRLTDKIVDRQSTALAAFCRCSADAAQLSG